MNPTEASAGKPLRWGMVVDLNRCVGCQTCTIACKHSNDTVPGVQWRRVLDIETGSFPDVERVFMVTGCQHCAEPPCVPVCPTGATQQRADGLVTMNYDVCIGCAYCAVSCPYQARTIVHDERWYYGVETKQEKAVAHPERLGVAQKCTFCVEKVDEAKERGLTPGVDLDVTPACSASCIAQAITFGDFNNSDSNVSQLVAHNKSFQMHAELGTDPQIKYLYEAPATPGRDIDADEINDERMADPSNPLVGKLQTFWDWRAAMNWCFGGLAGGTVFAAWVASWVGLIEPARLPGFFLLGAGLMSIGLVCVFLKIGRQERFWRAFARPNTSWMSRELYVVVVLFGALAAELVWPHPIIETIIAFAAIGFVYCQAQILHAAKGIPAWRAPLIPTMIFASGLFEGVGMIALLTGLVPAMVKASVMIAGTGLVLTILNAALFHRYRSTARQEGIPPLARRALDDLAPVVHSTGHALPALLFFVALVAPIDPATLLPLAGFSVLAGGFWWKFVIVTRASFQQGFALPNAPQRGSGKRAAPARLGGMPAGA
ncbi:MAG: 4Fe-4S dicluster domain-containing protein [Burkholderiales bacterium]